MSNGFKARQNAGGDESSHALSVALNNWLEEFGPPGIFQTCATCRNMKQEGPALCMKFNQTPPVAVIVKGCSEYDDAHEVPF